MFDVLSTEHSACLPCERSNSVLLNECKAPQQLLRLRNPTPDLRGSPLQTQDNARRSKTRQWQNCGGATKLGPGRRFGVRSTAYSFAVRLGHSLQRQTPTHQPGLAWTSVFSVSAYLPGVKSVWGTFRRPIVLVDGTEIYTRRCLFRETCRFVYLGVVHIPHRSPRFFFFFRIFQLPPFILHPSASSPHIFLGCLSGFQSLAQKTAASASWV